jgi:hypothetical protein
MAPKGREPGLEIEIICKQNYDDDGNVILEWLVIEILDKKV